MSASGLVVIVTSNRAAIVPRPWYRHSHSAGAPSTLPPLTTVRRMARELARKSRQVDWIRRPGRFFFSSDGAHAKIVRSVDLRYGRVIWPGRRSQRSAVRRVIGRARTHTECRIARRTSPAVSGH